MVAITKSNAFNRAIVGFIVLVGYFILLSQYGSYWSILLVPIGLLVLIFFIIIFINGIVFWINNSKKYSRPYLPFCIYLTAILIAYCLPPFERSKQHFINTGKLCNYKSGNCGCNLYAEYYLVYAQGAWGADSEAEYLTDSVNFRQYLGVFDQADEHINVDCNGDSITVTKTSTEFVNPNWSKPQIIEKKVYSLQELKRRHAFD